MNIAREKLLAIAAGVLVGGLVVSSLIVQPIVTRFREANEQAESLQNDVDGARSMKERLPDTRRDWATEKTRLGGTADEAEAAQAFVGHIREICGKSGLVAGDLRFITVDGKDSLRELIFEMKVSTQLDKLTDFLEALAASERPVRVSAMSVTPDQRSQGRELRVDMRLAALIVVSSEEKKS